MPTSVDAAKTLNNPDEIEISLVDIIKSIWNGRRFILFFTVAVVLACLGLAFGLAKYKSESLYYFRVPIQPVVDGADKAGTELSLEVHDRILNTIKTLRRFDAYLAASQLQKTPEIDMLRACFMSADGINKYISPLYPSLFGQDGRPRRKDGDESILGLRIALYSYDAELSYRAVTALTRYLVDMTAYEIYHDTLTAYLNQALAQGIEVENALIGLNTKRPHLLRQVAQMEALIEKYTKLFGANAQIRITAEDSLGSSPVAKIMSLQIELAALDEQVERLQRQQRQTRLIRAFYQRALDVHQETKFAQAFVARQPSILQEVFKDQDLSDEVIWEVFNTLRIRSQHADNLYQESIRLIVQATRPTTRTIKPGMGSIGAGALLIGLFMSIMIVLFRAWWRKVSV